MRLIHNSFEKFAHDVKGWNIDFRVLSKEPFLSYLHQIETRDLLVTNAHFSTKLEQRGEPPANKWTFALLCPGSPDILWRGQAFSRHVAVYGPGLEIDAYSPPGFKVVTISLATDIIKHWRQFYTSEGSAKLPSSGVLLPIEMQALQQILITAYQMLNESNQLRIEEYEELLAIQMLNTLWTTNSNTHKISRVAKYRKFRKIVDYIDENLSEEIMLNDLCRVGGISPRTIQRFFRDFIDDTPKKYIRTKRLNCVRKELIESRGKYQFISDIANKWGFWHLGQFASDYTHLFGELPSDTVKSRSTCKKKLP